MTTEQPQIGSVWTLGYPYYNAHQSLTVLVLDNSIQHHVVYHVVSTRVLVIYSDGTISEESWSSSAFGSTHRKYTLLYSLEERGET